MQTEPTFEQIRTLTQECYQSVFDKILAMGVRYDYARQIACTRTAYIISIDRISAYKLMVEFLSSREEHSRAVQRREVRMSRDDYRKAVMVSCTRISYNREKTIQVLETCLAKLPLYIKLS